MRICNENITLFEVPCVSPYANVAFLAVRFVLKQFSPGAVSGQFADLKGGPQLVLVPPPGPSPVHALPGGDYQMLWNIVLEYMCETYVWNIFVEHSVEQSVGTYLWNIVEHIVERSVEHICGT